MFGFYTTVLITSRVSQNNSNHLSLLQLNKISPMVFKTIVHRYWIDFYNNLSKINFMFGRCFLSQL